MRVLFYKSRAILLHLVVLKEITKENLDGVLALSVADDQKSFVSTNAESLAQAYVYSDPSYPFMDAGLLSWGSGI